MHATLNAITLAPILFLLCAAVGVFIMNRARRDLTVEQKAAIFDATPKRQSWLLAAMAPSILNNHALCSRRSMFDPLNAKQFIGKSQ